MATSPLGLVFVAQSAAAISEVLGQRMSRRCHHRSVLRAMVSMSIYCSFQAVSTLSLAELMLPVSWTGGQGALSMWSMLARHPWLLVNAGINAVYWVALAFLLREPMGAVLVVVAFLAAAFFVDPLKLLLGLHVESGGVTWWTLTLGLIGALACTIDVPPRIAGVILRLWENSIGRNAISIAQPAALERSDVNINNHRLSVVRDDDSSNDEHGELASDVSRLVHTEELSDSHTPNDAPTPAPVVAIAFCVLSITTAAGVTFMSVAENVAGLNAIGYAALDQVLLPLTTLPLVCAISSSPWARALIGEPPWSSASVGDQRLAPTFGALLRRTWDEVNAAAVGRSPLEAEDVPVPVPPNAAVSQESNVQRRFDGEASDSQPLGVVPAPLIGMHRELVVSTPVIGTVVSVDMASDVSRRASTGAIHSNSTALTSADITELQSHSRSHAAVMDSQVTPTRRRTTTSAAFCCSSIRTARAVAGISTPVSRSFWWTLIPFHGLEFGRTFLLFYLVTAYDSGSTYLTATLIRVSLVWVGAVLANSVLADWVGVSAMEARRALEPASLFIKAVGSACIVAAVVLQQQPNSNDA